MTQQTTGLRRVLTRRDLVIYGLVILTPTAPYPVYGLVQQVSHGHAALAYILAMAAMLFTAISYGKMSGAFPSAGSTYTYTSRALSPQIGFLAGWAMILDYFLIPLLSIIYASLTAHRLVPSLPYAFWAIAFTVLLTAINIPGIRMTTRASTIMMAAMTVYAVAFVVLAAIYVISAHGWAGLFQSSGWYRPDTFSLHGFMLGASIAAISYIGFDAISTLAEDTIQPERDIGFATVSVCVIQTAICVLTVYLAALVWPDFASYPAPETVILDIGKRIGGAWMFGSLSIILLVAGLASALTGQAGASRLLLGMGRDGVLSHKFFGYIHPRFATPTRGIYLMGAVSLAGSLFLRFESAVELLNFGAFAGFILVNLSVIRHFFFRLNRRRGYDFFLHLVSPALGALVCAYLWLSLSASARWAGFGWLAVGVIYLAFLTKGFRVQPKEMNLTEEQRLS